MSKFGSKEDILRVIETQFAQMQSSRLSMEDLESLVEHSRELYERTLILRYKAYEDKIFGEAREVLEEPEVEMEELSAPEPEWMEEEPVPVSANEAEEEANTDTEQPVNDEPVFDFALFDEEEEKEMPVFQLDTEEMSIASETEIVEEPAAIEEEPTAHEEEPTAHEEESTVESVEESAPHWLNESPSVEEEVPEAEVVQADQNENNSESDPFKSILQTDDSLASRFMLSKLDTLVGSFGFNEKFQCVQELFGGSGDDFNQAIEVLDSQLNFEEAKKQLLFYVHLNKWDLESEIAIEFIRKVERRYN